MPAIKFKVDKKKFIRALLRAPKEFSTELNREIAVQMEDVKEQAGDKHRYKTRSGELDRSITSKKVRDFTGQVFLDRSRAIYGPRIHQGWGTWRPDPFLFTAFIKRRRIIRREFQKALERAFKKAGF